MSRRTFLTAGSERDAERYFGSGSGWCVKLSANIGSYSGQPAASLPRHFRREPLPLGSDA